MTDPGEVKPVPTPRRRPFPLRGVLSAFFGGVGCGLVALCVIRWFLWKSIPEAETRLGIPNPWQFPLFHAQFAFGITLIVASLEAPRAVFRPSGVYCTLRGLLRLVFLADARLPTYAINGTDWGQLGLLKGVATGLVVTLAWFFALGSLLIALLALVLGRHVAAAAGALAISLGLIVVVFVVPSCMPLATHRRSAWLLLRTVAGGAFLYGAYSVFCTMALSPPEDVPVWGLAQAVSAAAVVLFFGGVAAWMALWGEGKGGSQPLPSA